MDELALVGGDGAEVAAAEAPAVGVHGELDHVVGRDALTLVPRVRKLGERQVPEGVHFLGGGRRERRIDLDIPLPYRLQDGVRMHHVGMGLYPMEVLRKSALVLAALFKTMQYKLSGGGTLRKLSTYVEGNLGNLLHAVAGPAFLDTLGEFQHGPFSHAVAEVIGPGSNQDGGHQAVFPVVVMGEAPEGSFYAADHNRDIRV